MVNIGIVGTGETVGIAHYHTEAIKRDSRAKLAAVYDLNPEGAARFVAAHGVDSKVCKSNEELLSLVEGVIICTPNNTHIDYAMQAMRAGRAVFVEKPLSVSPEACEPMLALLEERPVFNMTGFIYRFANQMSLLKKLVTQEIGRVYTFSATFGGKRLANPALPLEWRMRRATSGSGALGDFGSHLIDSAYFVAGLRFPALQAATQTFIPLREPDKGGNTKVENDDAAALQGIAENGALASFLVSRVGMDEIHILVTGEGGLARVALKENEPVWFAPKAADGAYTNELKRLEVAPQVYFDGWFYEETSAFISGVAGEEAPDIADIPHGYYVERLLHAADRASFTRRAAAD